MLDSFIFSLESVSNVYDQVYVIVDGLDECEKRKPLLDSLLKLLGKTINVFMTSRPEVDIKKRFRGISTLEMDKEHMQRDIATYVEWKLEHDESFKYFPLDLKSEIAQKLISKSNGM